MVRDGVKERPKLKPDDVNVPIVKRIFDMAETEMGMQDITYGFKDEHISSATGRLWYSNGFQFILKNEVYTGALVWDTTAETKAQTVRDDKALPAIVSKAKFGRVNILMRSRAPKKTHPRRFTRPTGSAGWSSTRRSAGRSAARMPWTASSPTTSASPS